MQELSSRSTLTKGGVSSGESSLLERHASRPTQATIDGGLLDDTHSLHISPPPSPPSGDLTGAALAPRLWLSMQAAVHKREVALHLLPVCAGQGTAADMPCRSLQSRLKQNLMERQ